MNVVEGLIAKKTHYLYELLMERLESGERLDYPAKVIELLLEQLKETKFSLQGALKLNIVVDLQNKNRLLFEQEKD